MGKLIFNVVTRGLGSNCLCGDSEKEQWGRNWFIRSFLFILLNVCGVGTKLWLGRRLKYFSCYIRPTIQH